MFKAYKYRIYPNDLQQAKLAQSFGCVRHIYNEALKFQQENYAATGKIQTYFDLTGDFLKEQKRLKPWLKEPSSQSLNMSCKNLLEAYSRFFKKQNKFPTNKIKTGHQSIQYPQHISVDFKRDRVKIPKLGEVFTRFDRKFEGKIKTCTLSKTPTNKYFISILVDNEVELPAKAAISPETSIGIDLGIKDFAILSNGFKIPNPKFLKQSLKRLQVLQRRASRKKKGSKNRRKAFLAVAKKHEHITNARTNFLQQHSTTIIRENQTIIVENLNVAGMIKNHKLARSIQDASWSVFITMLKYKCDWYGKNFIQIGRFEPSSKLCSECGWKNQDLKLKDRTWTCQECGVIHDRDLNATMNIKNFGLRQQAQSGREPSSELALSKERLKEMPKTLNLQSSIANLNKDRRSKKLLASC